MVIAGADREDGVFYLFDLSQLLPNVKEVEWIPHRARSRKISFYSFSRSQAIRLCIAMLPTT
ncbi:uncharacterized protein CANTADRAFT_205219 [Suhomyces tanzawaensis NRRL Y-17324]|uniref:Uncharacterized protein n=1 Tax=Suhomyces tanzawaensis NRRL Y-17324 TaxID=984487 RepID=A0A1E4SJ88_9ASCO|nr:uncharacterized protein CANTADRAFT_205219 [Suhomyces tanzawaensis NRRL Y-17324]ODV79573.1 hypothetical protein CANTADRAFT_205219 [Suhomyces tanzawaensis NRRL Y-17324]